MTLESTLRILALMAWVTALFAPGAVRAQADSVTIVAGAHYDAGGLQAALLGSDYRDIWTTPVRVPVLDLDRFAGGITPVERGSGLQTISLRFQAANGTEYNFRSVDKDQTGGLHPDFQDTTIDWILQDQVSSKHPVGALITSPLLEAAGVLHPAPQLYVMPDDPRLGEFRETFAGMLGLIEVHTNEGENDTPGFAGASRVADAETLLDHLEESHEHRADSREFLRARLMDLFFGDWDRHLGQWRWARFERDGTYWWVPVPEDRDNAFSSFDGLLLGLARGGAPHLNEFEATYPRIFGLVRNAQPLDREILSDRTREDFETMAVELQNRLTDSVIADAVAATPPEYYALRGAELERELRARRDALPSIAREFYALLAREVDVKATDLADRAVVELSPDGSLELQLMALEEGGRGEPYFSRRFLPGQTREVRVYLRGGDDEGVVRGTGGDGVRVRLVGGGDDDALGDSSTASGGRVLFYDYRGDNRIETGGSTVVDRREFVEPEAAAGGFNDNAPAFRDWGRDIQWFRPWAEWRYNIGPVIGGGPHITRYGFRRTPYARQTSLLALYAPLHTRFGVELSGDVRHTNSASRVTFGAHATQLAVTRFHGFGNETGGDGSSDLYKVWETEYMATAAYHRLIGERSELFVGPLLRYTRPEVEDGGPADLLQPFGSDPFGQVGALAGGVVDTRDAVGYPRHGARAELIATAYPELWDVPGAFGSVRGGASTYLPVPFPLETTLAVRAGGELAWGDFPLQEAAFLGGSGTLRGTPRERFAGESAAWAGAELRTFLTRFNFISRGDLGVIALADAGRVWVEGESSDRLHTGFGGGLWVGILDRTRTASLVFASGTENAVYLSLGMPF